MTKWSSGAKIVAASALGFLLTAGLCGMARIEDRQSHDGYPSNFDVLGGLAFLISGIVLLVGLLVLISGRFVGERSGSKTD